jgi:hypothetical protein
LPKSQRIAVALLQREGSEEAVAAAETLTVPWPIDVQRSLRAILDEPGQADTAKRRSLVEFVSTRGLAAPAAAATPELRIDDIRLVCYQIVAPK